jgi:hypothetical protein
MSKYDDLRFLKETKASAEHTCSRCGDTILVGQIYYSEVLKDRFLQSLNRKKYCPKCYVELTANEIR